MFKWSISLKINFEKLSVSRMDPDPRFVKDPATNWIRNPKPQPGNTQIATTHCRWYYYIIYTVKLRHTELRLMRKHNCTIPTQCQVITIDWAFSVEGLPFTFLTGKNVEKIHFKSPQTQSSSDKVTLTVSLNDYPLPSKRIIFFDLI